MFFHEEPKWDDEWDKTMTPTMSPTSYYYPHNNHNNYPSYAPVSQPHQQPTPMKPTKPDGKKFNIAFKNMGKENMYNGAFEKARSKFEKMIVGDLSDHPKISDSGSDQEHDWFAGTWPDQKVNTYIDDVLIGYEITDIDGPGNVLGFAGPLFIRLDDDTTGKNGGTFTTISGQLLPFLRILLSKNTTFLISPNDCFPLVCWYVILTLFPILLLSFYPCR